MIAKHFLAVAVVFVAAKPSYSQVVVQQPTFRTFTVSTTVFVPDRGSVYLGGVNRFGQTRLRSPYGPRPVAGTTIGGGVTVHATITDHRAIDRALLAEAARRRGATHDVLGRPVAAAPAKSASAPKPSSSRFRINADDIWRQR